MARTPSLITIDLTGDPYDSELFCPYCGEQILEPDGDGMGECPHLIHADLEEPVADPANTNDLCFRFYEPAPACRHHYFVFREAGSEEDGDGDG